jgi:SAM-dependent methyltransferase
VSLPPPRNADLGRRDALLTLLRDVVGPELAAEFDERAERFGDALLNGVNPAREDADGSWDQAKGEAFAACEGVGAVHLELGTFTAFPAERIDEIVAADGLSEFIRLDADPQYECDLVADATALPLMAGSVDRLASNSVLEHIAHPHQVLAECRRVLRPGGVMVHVVPFVWPQHGYPDDHLRYVPGFFERVLPELGFVDVQIDVEASAGLYNVLHNSAKMAGIDTRRAEAARMLELHELLISALGWLIPADRFFRDNAGEWFHSVRVLARAPGEYQPSHRPLGRAGGFAERALDLLADPATKQPLRRAGSRLICDSTGTSYPIGRDGSVNALEQTISRPSLLDRVGARVRKHR